MATPCSWADSSSGSLWPCAPQVGSGMNQVHGNCQDCYITEPVSVSLIIHATMPKQVLKFVLMLAPRELSDPKGADTGLLLTL